VRPRRSSRNSPICFCWSFRRFSSSRVFFNASAVPPLCALIALSGLVILSSMSQTTFIVRLSAILFRSASQAGLFPPFHQFRDCHFIHRGRCPVEHRRDVGHRVFYSLWKASLRLCVLSKKPA